MTWTLAEAQIAVTTKSKNLRVSKGMHTVPSGRGDGFSTTVANLLMRCALPASEVWGRMVISDVIIIQRFELFPMRPRAASDLMRAGQDEYVKPLYAERIHGELVSYYIQPPTEDTVML